MKNMVTLGNHALRIQQKLDDDDHIVKPSMWVSVCLSAVLLLCAACAPDEVAGPLNVVGSSPAPGATHPANAPIEVRFDGYLHPDHRWSDLASLKTGTLTMGSETFYDPVGRMLVVVPGAELRPNLGYTLTISAELMGIDGRTMTAPFELSFLTTVAQGRPPAPATVNFEADIAPIFAARCGCHGPEPKVHPPLTPSTLIDQPSTRQPERTLVIRGDPMHSHLVERILDGYPMLRGDSMPPDGTITDGERRLLISWIEGLP